MERDKVYERVRAKVEKLFGFYTHLAVYLCVNGVLFTINLMTSPGYLWAIWPLMGMEWWADRTQGAPERTVKVAR